MSGADMLAVEPNVLLRLLVRDDVRQDETADAAVASDAWVSRLVLDEAVWMLDTVYRRLAVAGCRSSKLPTLPGRPNGQPD